MTVSEHLVKAGLTNTEIQLIPQYIEGTLDFFDSPAYEKLFEYYAFELGEMPYGIAKARTGMPDVWILDHLVDLGY